MNARASARFALAETTQMPYRTGGCAHAGSLMTLTSFATVAASVL